MKTDNNSSLNGVIIINKPKGYTSHDIVNVLRKKLNIKKIGQKTFNNTKQKMYKTNTH